jgi:hypothetical protein
VEELPLLILVRHQDGSGKSSTPSLLTFSISTRHFYRPQPQLLPFCSSIFAHPFCIQQYLLIAICTSSWDCQGIAEQFIHFLTSRPTRIAFSCPRILPVMSLPTYEATIRGPNKLVFVAPYLDRLSLLAACLVSTEWHPIFAAQLWGDPIQSTAETRAPFGKKPVLPR